jgi:hypothetical protein
MKMLGLLWAQIRHHICTGFGVLDKIYGSTIEKLLYGKLHLSHAMGIDKSALSHCTGGEIAYIHLVVIDGVEEHIRPGDSFVYDTTTGTTNDNPELEPISADRLELITSKETIIAKM